MVSYTNLSRALDQTSVDRVFERCWKSEAGVVKFTWLTDTWPLLTAVTENRELPVVGKEIGPSRLTFSLLSRWYGSPWIYAALARGMETFDEEVTVAQLEEEYCWSEVTRQTRFVEIVGCGTAKNTTARILNGAFKGFEVPIRCLPGCPDRLRRMLEARARGCRYVSPAVVFASGLQNQLRHLTGKSLPLEAFRKGLAK